MIANTWAVREEWKPGDAYVEHAPITGRCRIMRPPVGDQEQRYGEKVADGVIVHLPTGDFFGLWYDKATHTYCISPVK